MLVLVVALVVSSASLLAPAGADAPPLEMFDASRICAPASSPLIWCAAGTELYFASGTDRLLHRCNTDFDAHAVVSPVSVEIGETNTTISTCFADESSDAVIVVADARVVYVASRADFKDSAPTVRRVAGRTGVVGFTNGNGTAVDGDVVSFGVIAGITKSALHPDVFFLIDSHFHQIRVLTAATPASSTVSVVQRHFEVSTFAGDNTNATEGDDDGVAHQARFRSPFAIAAFSRFLFVADRPPSGSGASPAVSWRIRRVDSVTAAVSTLFVPSGSVTVGAVQEGLAHFYLRPLSTSDGGSLCVYLLLDPVPASPGGLEVRDVALLSLQAQTTLSSTELLVSTSNGAKMIGFSIANASASIPLDQRIIALGATVAANDPLEVLRFTFPRQRSDICHVSCAAASEPTACAANLGCFWEVPGGPCQAACWTYRSSATCPAARCSFFGGRCQPTCAGLSNTTCASRAGQCSWVLRGQDAACEPLCPPSESATAAGFVYCSGSCTPATASCRLRCESYTDPSLCGAVAYCSWDPARSHCRSKCNRYAYDGCTASPNCMYATSGDRCISSCSTHDGNGTSCAAAPSSLCSFDQSASRCQRFCDRFTGPGCGILASGVTANSTIASVVNSSISDCILLPQSLVADSRGTCVQNCGVLRAQSDCLNHLGTCYWHSPSGATAPVQSSWPRCRVMCASMAPSRCASYCANDSVIHPTRRATACHPDCRLLSDRLGCEANGCLWSESQCKVQCQWLTFEACFSEAHCTTTSLNVSLWNIASQCVFTCGNLDQTSCAGVPHCYWSGISCQDRCQTLPAQGTTCTAKRSCYVGPASGCFQDCSVLPSIACDVHSECMRTSGNRCRNKCASILFAVVTSGAGYAYEGRIYSCMRDDCVFLPNPHGCFPRCDAYATESLCAADDCTWLGASCASQCSTMSETQCTVAADCDWTFDVTANRSSCHVSCGRLASQSLCETHGSRRCRWSADQGLCVADCSYYRQVDACPTGCSPSEVLFNPDRSTQVVCREECHRIINATECHQSGCSWFLDECQYPCQWLSADACASALHCFDPAPLISPTSYSPEQCLTNCLAFSEDECAAAPSHCIWAESVCVPICSAIPAAAGYCPTHAFDNSVCHLGTQGCMQTCSALPNATCEVLPECVWDTVTRRCQFRCNFTLISTCDASVASAAAPQCFWGQGICRQNCSTLPASMCTKHSECLFSSSSNRCRNKCKTINPQTVLNGFGYAYEGRIYSCMRDDCVFLPNPHGCFPRCDAYATESLCAADDCTWLGASCASQCSTMSETQCTVAADCDWIGLRCLHTCAAINTTDMCSSQSNGRCAWDVPRSACVDRCSATPRPSDCDPSTPAPSLSTATTPTSPPPTSAAPATTTMSPPVTTIAAPPPTQLPTTLQTTVAPTTPRPTSTTAVTTPTTVLTLVPTTGPLLSSDPSTSSPTTVVTTVSPDSTSSTAPFTSTETVATHPPSADAPTTTALTTAGVPTAAPLTLFTPPATAAPTSAAPQTTAATPTLTTTLASTAQPTTTAELTEVPGTQQPATAAQDAQREYQIRLSGDSWAAVLGDSTARMELEYAVNIAVAQAVGVSASQVTRITFNVGSLIIGFFVVSNDVAQPDLANTQTVVSRLESSTVLPSAAAIYAQVTGQPAANIVVVGVAAVVGGTSAPPQTTVPEQGAGDGGSWCNNACIGGFVGGGVGLIVIVAITCYCCRRSSGEKDSRDARRRRAELDSGGDHGARVRRDTTEPTTSRPPQTYGTASSSAPAPASATTASQHANSPSTGNLQVRPRFSASQAVPEQPPNLSASSSDGGRLASTTPPAPERRTAAVAPPLINVATLAAAPNTPQPTPPVSPGQRVSQGELISTSGDWECSICTYKNDAGRTNCEICENSRADDAPEAVAVQPQLSTATLSPRAVQIAGDFPLSSPTLLPIDLAAIHAAIPDQPAPDAPSSTSLFSPSSPVETSSTVASRISLFAGHPASQGGEPLLATAPGLFASPSAAAAAPATPASVPSRRITISDTVAAPSASQAVTPRTNPAPAASLFGDF